MKTICATEAAMSAVPTSGDVVRHGGTTAHAVDLGQRTGRALSAAAGVARARDLAGRIVGNDTFAPTTGFAYPRLEGPPV